MAGVKRSRERFDDGGTPASLERNRRDMDRRVASALAPGAGGRVALTGVAHEDTYEDGDLVAAERRAMRRILAIFDVSNPKVKR